jgi:D-glycerate 3-kinase
MRGASVERSLEFYLSWLRPQVDAPVSRPVFIGISAPQGAGKTTLVRKLVPALEEHGLRAVAISIDDFYLTRAEQLALAAAHPGNRILEYRGAPGTHDISLGDAVLERLSRLGPGETMKLPAYDKSAHEGRGDRAPEEAWPVVVGPLDVVLLEGWCWAFQPVPPGALVDPALRPVNDLLPAYGRWQRRMRSLLAWRAESLKSIVSWRVAAEAQARAAGRTALNPAAAEDYIRRFLPVYRTYQDTIARGPWKGQVLELTLGAQEPQGRLVV